MTSADVEIAVALWFDARQNLVVPNVHWGWGLRHEADLLVLRPSGLRDEVEIKVSRADIKADAKKRWSHWSDRRISRVWFAVPQGLQDCPWIPQDAGILVVQQRVYDYDLRQTREWRPGDPRGSFQVTAVRPAKIRASKDRVKVSAADRLKLAELGAVRIWNLKAALIQKRVGRPPASPE